MATPVTLADGSKASVDKSNYADLARLQISLERDKFGAQYDSTQQAATLNAFKQLAGEDIPYYDYTSRGAVVNVPSATADVLNNPGVIASDAITNNAPKVAKAVWSGVTESVSEWTGNIKSEISALSTTGKALVGVAILAGIVGLLYYGDRLFRDVKEVI